MNPAAVKMAGKICGSLPLHLAARNNCSMEVLEILLLAYPAAANMRTYSGETPLTCGKCKVGEVVHRLGLAS